jgi:hypothetical protein
MRSCAGDALLPALLSVAGGCPSRRRRTASTSTAHVLCAVCACGVHAGRRRTCCVVSGSAASASAATRNSVDERTMEATLNPCGVASYRNTWNALDTMGRAVVNSCLAGFGGVFFRRKPFGLAGFYGADFEQRPGTREGVKGRVVRRPEILHNALSQHVIPLGRRKVSRCAARARRGVCSRGMPALFLPPAMRGASRARTHGRRKQARGGKRQRYRARRTASPRRTACSLPCAWVRRPRRCSPGGRRTLHIRIETSPHLGLQETCSLAWAKRQLGHAH